MYESSDDYDELLFFLLVSQNSSSSLTSKTISTMLKGAAEPGSMQLSSLLVSTFARIHTKISSAKTRPTKVAGPRHSLPIHPPSRLWKRGMKIRKWQCFRTSSRFPHFCQIHCSAHCILFNLNFKTTIGEDDRA